MPPEVMGMLRGVATTGSRRSSLRRLEVARADGRANLPAVFAESLAAMSATKLPGPEGHQKLGPLAARPPAPRAEPATAAVAQEKVLAEIAHELGNFFHKLYYWSDYLKEKPARKSADSTAAQMLERTIKNLEDFLKVSLDYFHPTQLSFTRVGPESSVTVAIERSARRDRAGLEVGFQLHQPNEASALFRTAEAGIEWAVAQKVVALHGGELLERNEGAEEKSLVIFLPLCP